MEAQNKGALDGVTVVDFSVMISGPLAGMILADQGAQVIKVESPDQGDLMRHLGSTKGQMSGIYANNNRGKRSLVVDLKTPQGLEIIKTLVERADVLIQNFRPGAMERLGLGYEAMSALNPDLIYTSISGYGPDGPNCHHRVYDNIIQAASGLASVQADPATGTPALYRTLICDKTTAYTAAQAITAALFARATGAARGQHITLAMLDAAIAFMWPDSAMDAALLDSDVARTPPIGAYYSPTPLSDGYVTTSAVSESEFRGLCTAYGHPEIADDPRFSTTAARSRNVAEMRVIMKELASKITVEEFLRGCEEHQGPAAKVMALDEVPSHPQVIHNETFVERLHPAAGMMREPRPPARFSATPSHIGAPSAMAGQHSDEIVTELGFDAEALRTARIIA
jgi:crotonobetainyl-CoA:carnitine CoA-transferase CaiB-like acyl-CoA transferase